MYETSQKERAELELELLRCREELERAADVKEVMHVWTSHTLLFKGLGSVRFLMRLLCSLVKTLYIYFILSIVQIRSFETY